MNSDSPTKTNGVNGASTSSEQSRVAGRSPKTALLIACILLFTLVALHLMDYRDTRRGLSDLALAIAEEIFNDRRNTTLLLYAHSSLFEFTPELDWPARLSEQRRRLGSLRTIGSLTAEIDRGLLSAQAGEASYRIRAQFASGPATIEIDFVESSEEWLVSSLRVDAQALKL